MRLLRHIFLCGFALILLPVALAQAPAAEDKNKVILNFVGADIQSVVKTIGMITGTNFILDPRVTGTVNIISAKPVERDLVYPILLSALRMQGFAAVESPNGVVKIVPEADAKLNYSPTLLGRPQVAGDRIITQVYPLRYESAVQLVPVLRPLIAPNNVINAYPNSNTLVITDYAENLRRIDKIISAIDVAPASELHTIKLEHASAIDVAQLLTRLMPEASAPTAVPGGQPKLVFAVDARVNSLIVRSDAPATLEKVRTLIRGMDVPSAAGGNIRVVYLRNAEATKVAETLRGILSGGTGGGQAVAAPATPAAPGQPAAAPAAAPVTIPASAGGGTIQAYPATNSLVIVAPDYVYNSLRDVIDKLDARRAQVFVEALIAEVSTTTAAEFGIQWQDLSGINSTDTKVIGGTNFSTSTAGAGTNIIGAARNIATVGPGLNVGVVKGRINIPGVGEVLNLGALARALESQANANILSTPNLLTIDNEEAKIVVGQNVPFVTGSFSQATGTTGAAVNPFQTIERRDVGLTLKVKPTVAEGGTIKLQIFQEVSSLTRTANVSTADVVTNKRSIESTVLVDDGQIVVLGGLIQDDVQNSQDKVPLLGNIPIIGNLFKYDSRRRVKTNLMVFIRPVVLRDGQAPGQITNERYDYIRKEQAGSESPPHWLLPDVGGPKLPEQKPQSMLEPYMRLDRGLAAPADARAAPAQVSPTQSTPAAEPAPAYETRPTPNNPMGGVARQRDSATRLTVPKTTSDAAAAAPAPAAPVKRAPPPPTSAPAAQAPATAVPVVPPAPVAAPTQSAQTKPMPAAVTAPATPAPVVAQPAPVATPSSAVKAAQAPAKPAATPPAKVAAAPAKPAATAPRPSSTSYRPPRPGAKPSDVGLFGDNLMPAATSTKPRVN